MPWPITAYMTASSETRPQSLFLDKLQYRRQGQTRRGFRRLASCRKQRHKLLILVDLPHRIGNTETQGPFLKGRPCYSLRFFWNLIAN